MISAPDTLPLSEARTKSSLSEPSSKAIGHPLLQSKLCDRQALLLLNILLTSINICSVPHKAEAWLQELIALQLVAGLPGIAHLIEALETKDWVCFVLEPCSQADLRTIINPQHLPEDEAAAVCSDMVETATYLQQLGTINCLMSVWTCHNALMISSLSCTCALYLMMSLRKWTILECSFCMVFEC